MATMLHHIFPLHSYISFYFFNLALDPILKMYLHIRVFSFCIPFALGIFHFSPNFNLLGREEEILRKKNEEYLLLNFPCDVRKNLRGARFAEDKKAEDSKVEDKKAEDKKEEDKKAEEKKTEDPRANDNRTEDKKTEKKKEVVKEADKLPVGRFSEKHTPSNQDAPQITPSNQDPPPLDEKATSANHKARPAILEPGLAGQDKARVGGSKQGQGTTQPSSVFAFVEAQSGVSCVQNCTYALLCEYSKRNELIYK